MLVEDDGKGTRLETPRLLLSGRRRDERVPLEVWDGEGPLYVRTSTGCE